MSYIFPNEDSKTLLFTLLKILGGRKVEVHFSGGGDSGNIDNACLLNQDNEPIDIQKASLPWFENKSSFDSTTNKWVNTFEQVESMPLNDILVGLTENALENEGLDWYNNEGGQGAFRIDLTTTPPSIELTVEINRTEVDSYDFDYTENKDEEGEDNAPISS